MATAGISASRHAHDGCFVCPSLAAADDAYYYFNVNTGEATWEKPEELAWEHIDSP